jgi:hypothetical protein
MAWFYVKQGMDTTLLAAGGTHWSSRSSRPKNVTKKMKCFVEGIRMNTTDIIGVANVIAQFAVAAVAVWAVLASLSANKRQIESSDR